MKYNQDREPAVAGMFYNGDPTGLADEVDGFLATAMDVDLPSELSGLIVPHAGYAYSGAVAAAAYKAISEVQPDVVVLLGPCHRRLYDFISVGAFSRYVTPLGGVPVDLKLAEKLIDAAPALFKKELIAHQAEHSIEVQLPFLQRIWPPGFKILPLLFGGSLSKELLEESAAVLHKLRHEDSGRRWLYICSTDLSHDHPYPEAVEMDRSVAEAVKTLNVENLSVLFNTGQGEACGRDGLTVFLQLGRLAAKKRAVICDLRNSGDVVGDTESRIVGYLSALM